MKILDRYIIRQFLINFVILTTVLMLLFVVVDLIVALDEFLEAGRVRAAWFVVGGDADTQPGFVPVLLGTLWSVGDYYGPLIVLIYVFFSGLLVTAAMGFTFAGLVRSHEMLAVLTSGVSLYRIAVPVLVVGCMLNALTLPSQEYLIPKLAPKLARKQSQVKYDRIQTFDVQFAPDRSGNLLSAAEFDPEHNLLRDVTILERDHLGPARRRIRAEQAIWVNDADRTGWQLIQGSVGDVNSLSPEPLDFYPTDLSPQVLLARRAAIYPRLLSFAELNELMHSVPNTSQIQQIIHSRFSLMVVNVLVLVMGLPFFLLRDPQTNLFIQAIKAATVCVGGWAAALLIQQIGVSYLNPVAAAWRPVVLYLPASAILLPTGKT